MSVRDGQGVGMTLELASLEQALLVAAKLSIIFYWERMITMVNDPANCISFLLTIAAHWLKESSQYYACSSLQKSQGPNLPCLRNPHRSSRPARLASEGDRRDSCDALRRFRTSFLCASA